LWTVLILLAAVGTAGGVASALLKSEPAFYTAEPAAGANETGERAGKILTRYQDFQNDVRLKADWSATFPTDDIDCFLRQSFADGGSMTAYLPQGVHSPRLTAEGDTIKIGFRYGRGLWSTVVSLELKTWLVKDETDLIAVEVVNLKAGALPIGGQALLDGISEAAHESNVEVHWYRTPGGNPVGLFRLYADQLRPATVFGTLKVADGAIVVAGRTRVEATPAGANE
jgi:hypothetical protein